MRVLSEAVVSNARLNATGAVLCRIKYDSPCHIICDWAQFQAEIRTLGEARQCGEARSRICQISMPWWVLLLVEAETRHKLGDFSQSQIIWQPQSRLMRRLTPRRLPQSGIHGSVYTRRYLVPADSSVQGDE